MPLLLQMGWKMTYFKGIAVNIHRIPCKREYIFQLTHIARPAVTAQKLIGRITTRDFSLFLAHIDFKRLQKMPDK